VRVWPKTRCACVVIGWLTVDVSMPILVDADLPRGGSTAVYLVCTCRASRSTTNREINCRLATHIDSPLSLIQCPVDLSVQASRAPLFKYLPSISIHRMFIDSASPSCGDVALPRCKPAYIPLTNRFRVHERGSRVVSTTSVAL
jgi:hypothetical protein